MIVIILMALLTCGGGQQIPPTDGNTLILMTVIDTLDSLSLQLKEFQVKVEAKFEEVQANATEIIETQKTIRADIKEVQANVTGIIGTQKTIQTDIKDLQQCSTKAQLSQFQELVFKDDCEDGRSDCSNMSTCTDHFNRYECSCLPGYSGNGFTCHDVNECVQGIATCGIDELCSNNPGSYTCHCQEGYRKEGDTCQDIDECSENNNVCGNHSTCLNDIGSYTCICDKYFRRVGDICQGPVCKTSPTSLFLPETGCLTIVEGGMTWAEGKSKCQELGRRLAEGLQRQHFQALSDHFWPMIQTKRSFGLWVGLQRRHWIHQEEEEEIQNEDWKEGEPNGDLKQCGYVRLHPSSLGLGDYGCSSSFYPLCQSLP